MSFLSCPRSSLLKENHHQAIKLDPSSPLGYERKHTILCGTRRYADAIDAFKTMFLVVSQSSDPEIHGKSDNIVLVFIY